MNKIIKHIPVMQKEAIESLNIQKNGIYIDSTFGMGGHSTAILKKLGKKGKLYSFDKDPYAISIGYKIQDKRFHILHQNFSNILNFAKCKNIIGKVHGILFDLGISSEQVENYERGFSFKKNGFLDMRMNPNIGISASDWLFKSNIDKISYVLKNFGEERFSKKIAYNIKKYQIKKKLQLLLNW